MSLDDLATFFLQNEKKKKKKSQTSFLIVLSTQRRRRRRRRKKKKKQAERHIQCEFVKGCTALILSNFYFQFNPINQQSPPCVIYNIKFTLSKYPTISARATSPSWEAFILQKNDCFVLSTCLISKQQRGKSTEFSGEFQASLDMIV